METSENEGNPVKLKETNGNEEKAETWIFDLCLKGFSLGIPGLQKRVVQHLSTFFSCPGILKIGANEQLFLVETNLF